jgi:hypothetical protein
MTLLMVKAVVSVPGLIMCLVDAVGRGKVATRSNPQTRKRRREEARPSVPLSGKAAEDPLCIPCCCEHELMAELLPYLAGYHKLHGDNERHGQNPWHMLRRLQWFLPV